MLSELISKPIFVVSDKKKEQMIVLFTSRFPKIFCYNMPIKKRKPVPHLFQVPQVRYERWGKNC